MRNAVILLSLAWAAVGLTVAPAACLSPAPSSSAPLPSSGAPLPLGPAQPGAIGAACANLRRIPCDEGFGGIAPVDAGHPLITRSCEEAMQLGGTIVDLKIDCLTAAKSKADARACGSVKCP